jgi:hypothetical protein
LTDGCAMTTVTDASQWEALFSRVDRSHMVQSWAYGEAKRAAGRSRARRSILDAGGWRPRRFVVERDGAPVAIGQLLEKSVAGLRVASRLNRGPLLLDGVPGDDVVADVYGTLRRRWKRRGVLILAPALADTGENHSVLSKLGFRPRGGTGWVSNRVDLRLDADQLRANLTHRWRNRLKVAERSGLEFTVSQTPEDLEWMLARHAENMAEKGFSSPAPYLIRALHAAAPQDVFVGRALLDEETPVGGMIAYRFGRGAEYYAGWMAREHRSLMVGNLLYWNMALELRLRGCAWVDLGGQRAGATETFKQGMGGVEYRLLGEWLAY